VFKTTLKRISLFYALNAHLKSIQTRARYDRIQRYYQRAGNGKGAEHRATVALGPDMDNLRRQLAPGAVPRVLYVCSDYDQDSSGLLPSLERWAKVEVFRLPHVAYKWGDGARESNGRQIIAMARSILAQGPLHLLLGQMWNFNVPWQALAEVRRMGAAVANICMDDRHAFWRSKENGEWTGSAGLIPGLDLALTAAPEVVRWYAAEGLPALFWPEASDPAVFHPMDLPQVHDVCFVGGNYGIRAQIVRTIEKKGIHVTCYGSGWPNGRIATEEMPKLFAQSKIVLGVGTIGHCSDFYALKLRDFDAAMSGSMYLTHANPDLYNLFDVGKEIVCYRTPEECAELCAYYLAHEAERERIARAGLERARRDHTWDARFQMLFKTLDLLPRSSNPQERFR